MNEVRNQGRWPTTQVTLLERIRDSDDALSWREFLQIYGPLIIKYCQRRGLQEDDGRDIAQEVMIYVSKAIESFRYDPERGQFRGWLGTITHRTMLKHLLRKTRMQHALLSRPLSISNPCHSLGDVWLETFAAHVYDAAVRRIQIEFDRATWEAFVQTFARDRPAEEVATELQRTTGWVYQAKSKVVRRLKSEILLLAEDSALVDFVRDSGIRGKQK